MIYPRPPFSLLILPIALSAPIAACDSCGCHAPPVLGDVSPGFSLGVFEQYTDFSTLKTEGEKADNPTGQWMRSSTTQFIVGYRINQTFSASLYLPYVSRSYQRPNNGETEHGTVAGLGDSSLLGSARVVHLSGTDAEYNTSLLLGIKAPTGDPSQLKYERDGGGNEDPDNAVGGHDLALGSGSWDVILGANTIGRVGRWYAAGQVTYTYHTEGAYQYRIANEITATGSLGCFVWMEGGNQVGIQVNVTGESKGYDRVVGEEMSDAANHNLFIGPEVNARLHERLTGLIGLDLPVIENNSDTQLVPTWRMRASLSWAF